jgi:hypothetical protein
MYCVRVHPAAKSKKRFHLRTLLQTLYCHKAIKLWRAISFLPRPRPTDRQRDEIYFASLWQLFSRAQNENNKMRRGAEVTLFLASQRFLSHSLTRSAGSRGPATFEL